MCVYVCVSGHILMAHNTKMHPQDSYPRLVHKCSMLWSYPSLPSSNGNIVFAVQGRATLKGLSK